MSLSNKDKEFNNLIVTRFSKKNEKELLSELKDYYDTYANLRTRSIKYSMAKKFFKEEELPSTFVNNVAPGKGITQKVISQNVDKLMSTKIIKIKKDEVDKMCYFGDSGNFGDLAISLLVSTGRRTGEILSGKFKIKKGSNDSILFKGILKKRLARNTEKFSEIKTLIHPKIVMDYFNLFQAIYKDKFIKKTGETMARMEIGERLKERLKSKNIDSTHLLRVIYANYLFKYDNKEDLIYNVYISKVINHKGIMASVNYTSVKIVD